LKKDRKTLKDIVKRATACLLALVLLFTTDMSFPFLISADENTPYILLDGEKTDSIVLREDARFRLFAVSESECDSFMWQIAHPEKNNVWINIDRANENKLWLTAALISSMADMAGKASIRCKITSGNDEFYTDPVVVTLSYNTKSSTVESAVHGIAPRIKMKAAKPIADEYTTYSIVINYVFGDNSIAFESYGATVAAGSNFTDPITSPTIVGYEPYRYMGDDYIPADVVYPEIYDIQENVTINVVYEPALVDFFIHHHKQDIYDDNYSVTPDKVTQSKAPTGTLVGDGLAFSEDEWQGFKPLAYERLEVAADSSTTIEIRYDRKYYLIDFEMNGGYGAEPVYTRFEATVGTDTPIRHGYIFDGWELVSYGGKTPTAEQKAMYDINGKTISVPAANLTYSARWIIGETKYTMVFWCENADDSEYSYWGHLDGLYAMSGDRVNGRDLISQVEGIDDEAYFEFNAQKSDKNVLVEGDGTTVVNVYYTRKLYTITFKAPGMCSIEANHKHGDDCYEAICGKNHVHSSECIRELICEKEPHSSHTDECIICKKELHVHGGIGCECNKTEHSHSIDCWGENVGSETSAPSRAPDNPENGYIYYRYNIFNTNYYIYLFGNWYRYNGEDVYSGLVLDPECNLEEHTHGTDCDCAEDEHLHNDDCYKDKLHTHSDDCYKYSCGEDEHIHENDCLRLICAYPENHNHSTSCNSSSQNNTVKLVKEKYGKSLDKIWPIKDDNNVSYNSGQRWTPSSSSYYKNVLVYIAQMPADDFTLTLSSSSASAYTMLYYLQTLPGEEDYDVSLDGYNYKLLHTIVAKYNYVTKAEDFFDIMGYYQYKSSPSFSSNGQINTGGGEVKFYYNRIVDHKLEFNNNGTVLENKSVSGIPYGSLLTDYNFTPDYPSNLEPAAYQFGGWYTSPGCFDGTEVKWDKLTMSAGDMMLYAKWTPTVHEVKVFLDSSLKTQIGNTEIVPHGSFANEPLTHIENENYIFQGWFYVDEGEEKAFVFKGIPIRKSINVYAKWGSHAMVEYEIYYKLKDTDIDVAAPTFGSSIAGNNKTFEAKAGNDLYSEYQTGYYPNISSHTITMSITGDHKFTFYYNYVESIPYKVRYVDENGNDLLSPVIITDNRLSVVTETFVKIDKRMPDAYQKRLILTSEGVPDEDGVFDNNIITFHYKSDEVHAYYKVVHYIQNLMGNSYREYRSEELVGIIGNNYTVNAITLTGFRYESDQTTVVGGDFVINGNTVTATLGEEGLLIELYYNREEIGYLVQYVDQNMNTLIEDKYMTGIFGEQILEYAPNLSEIGYSLVSDNLKMLTLSAAQERNVIIFMYEEANASIKYEIVGPTNCGTLIPMTENIKAVNGTVNGSTATANPGFIFAGWYLDAECKTPVDPSLVDSDNKLVPVKNGAIWKDTTYYARFDALVTNLVISTHSVSHFDRDQSFIFTIEGKADSDQSDVKLTVVLLGNSSVTIENIPVGNYTVTLHDDWAWRFKGQETVKPLRLDYNDGHNSVSFVMSKSDNIWLDANSEKENIF